VVAVVHIRVLGKVSQVDQAAAAYLQAVPTWAQVVRAVVHLGHILKAVAAVDLPLDKLSML
jgi:hypothetical protein